MPIDAALSSSQSSAGTMVANIPTNKIATSLIGTKLKSFFDVNLVSCREIGSGRCRNHQSFTEKRRIFHKHRNHYHGEKKDVVHSTDFCLLVKL